MKDVTTLHRDAMKIAEEGFLARFLNDKNREVLLLREAYEKEKAAAALVAGQVALEPTRSVLHRSAASLALECGEIREAERLISIALSGEPPDEIAEELRNLQEQANFQRHLKLQGISLLADEFQVSLCGKAIGFGFLKSQFFHEKIMDLESMISRTSDRKLDRPFRERGRGKKDFDLYLSVPRAASFAISLKIAIPGKFEKHGQQVEISGTSFAEEVIDELFECLGLFDRFDFDTLKSRINDDAYFNNFTGLARNIAPDGDEIKSVGFTYFRSGQEKELKLSMPKTSIPEFETQTAENVLREATTLNGILEYADATSQEKGIIKIIDEQGRKHKVRVPSGMMNDIVRPNFGYKVNITGQKENKIITLDKITKINEETILD